MEKRGLRHRKIFRAFTRLKDPFIHFLQLQQASGYLLLIATGIALLLANSAFGYSFVRFWHTSINFHFFSFTIEQFVNDGLMTIFFTVVGLEIKRELVDGALSTKEQAILPVVGALGGMVFPALIFLYFNLHEASQAGWAIPTATDIAFSLAVIQLLGNRVPMSLKIFLTALAVVDDLGAIIVIAVFYSEQLNWFYLFFSLVFMSLLLLMNKHSVRNVYIWFFTGAFVWFCLHEAGIHPTISGVILALFVPLKVNGVRNASSESPLNNMLHKLHGVSGYVVMPLFAFCNAGIILDVNALGSLLSPLSLGIFFALIFGKSLGITFTTMFTSRLGITKLPVNVKIYDLFLVNILAGIGFTMSIFVTNLAYKDIQMIETAKLSIIITSLTAGLLGFTLIRLRNTNPR